MPYVRVRDHTALLSDSKLIILIPIELSIIINRARTPHLPSFHTQPIDGGNSVASPNTRTFSSVIRDPARWLEVGLCDELGESIRVAGGATGRGLQY